MERVSVVVRRMYYWDLLADPLLTEYLVSVVVRRMYYWDEPVATKITSRILVSVVVRRMYYWDNIDASGSNPIYGFSSC